MKKFLSKTALYLFLVVTLYILIYCVYEKILANTAKDNKALYIWGDSQTYQGLILDQIEDSLHLKCFTSAEHGNGVYDFLVFTESVPDSAECLIGMSEALLYRNISSDNNHSGANFKALYELFKCGYSINELCNIAQTNNFTPKKNLFTNSHSTYTYADTIYYAESLDSWKGLFTKNDNYHPFKKKAYSIGLQKLIDKGCTVHIITYPIYKEIESFAKTTPNRYATLKYQSNIIKKHHMTYQQVFLESDSLLMHDLSHLNEIGARLATDCVINHVQQNNSNSFLEIKINDSSLQVQ